jgi:hypothetical protein
MRRNSVLAAITAKAAPRLRFLVACGVVVAASIGAPLAIGNNLALAVNDSRSTLCAEEDNINIPLVAPNPHGRIVSFEIAATHPGYAWTTDYTAPDFSNCHFSPGQDYTFPDPQSQKIYDDGQTVIVANRQERSWQPTGMTATGNLASLSDTHFIALHRRTDTGDYPQILVLYADGNLRLKPLPPSGVRDTVFGTSVIVGPAARALRPVVDIATLNYDSATESLLVGYHDGQSAIIRIAEASRAVTRVSIEADFMIDSSLPAFATLRSMYVATGNADADQLAWRTADGLLRSAPVLDVQEAVGTEFLLHRTHWSAHNTSAPDIRIGNMQLVPEPGGLVLAATIAWLVVVRRQAGRRSSS